MTPAAASRAHTRIVLVGAGHADIEVLRRTLPVLRNINGRSLSKRMHR